MSATRISGRSRILTITRDRSNRAYKSYRSYRSYETYLTYRHLPSNTTSPPTTVARTFALYSSSAGIV